jgi:hypothetical protein
MKPVAAAAFALPLFAIATVAAAERSGSLCVERAEDEGAVNIYPVQLTIDKLTQTFFGGSKSCLPLSAGAHNVELSWPIFDWQRADHGLRGTVRDNEFALAIISSDKKTNMAICSTRSKDHVRWRIISGDVKGCR